MMNTIGDVGADISWVLLLLSIWLSYRVIARRPDLAWFEVSLWWAFIIQFAAFAFAFLYQNNMPMLHLHTLMEFLIYGLFYHDILYRTSKYRRHVKLAIISVISIIIFNSLIIEPVWMWGATTNGKIISHIAIIVMAIWFFFKRTASEISRDSHALNIINAAILVYYSGSLLYFAFMNVAIRSTSELRALISLVNAYLYLAYLITVTIVRWRIVYRPSTKPHSESLPTLRPIDDLR